MNKNQFLLLKLAEECAEVAHVAIKQIQFGKDNVRKQGGGSNAERLRSELLDLTVLWSMLEESGEVQRWGVEEFDEVYRAKKSNMQKYLDKSFELGQLPEIKL